MQLCILPLLWDESTIVLQSEITWVFRSSDTSCVCGSIQRVVSAIRTLGHLWYHFPSYNHHLFSHFYIHHATKNQINHIELMPNSTIIWSFQNFLMFNRQQWCVNCWPNFNPISMLQLISLFFILLSTNLVCNSLYMLNILCSFWWILITISLNLYQSLMDLIQRL